MPDRRFVGRADRETLVDLLIYRYFIGADVRLVRETATGLAPDLIEAWSTDDLALMDELDALERWTLTPLRLPESTKAEFEIRLAPDRLRQAIERALADARAASAAGAPAPKGATEDLFARAAQVCEALLAEIDRTEESG